MPTDTTITEEFKPSTRKIESCGPCHPPEPDYDNVPFPNLFTIIKTKT